MNAPEKIIDGHLHLKSSRYIPFEFIEGVTHNLCASSKTDISKSKIKALAKSIWQQNNDHLGDRLVSEMEEANIEKVVLLAPDFSMCFKSACKPEEMAYEHYKICKRHNNKFWVFMGLDPRYGEEALTHFKRSVEEYGINGLKLYPPCGYSPSDRSLFPIYELCIRYNLPVLIHTGPTSPVMTFKYSNPMLVDDAAREYPELNFILAHGGVSWVNDAVDLCLYRPNVYLDVSGYITKGVNNWKHHLKNLFSKGINHKIIFGTDWPLASMSGTYKRQIDEFVSESGPLSEIGKQDSNNIMWNNISYLINHNRTERFDV